MAVSAEKQYTKEQLAQAKLEIGTLTSESYLEKVDYIEGMEKALADLEAAPRPVVTNVVQDSGVHAFGAAKTTLYGSHGGRIDLTSSRPTLAEAETWV